MNEIGVCLYSYAGYPIVCANVRFRYRIQTFSNIPCQRNTFIYNILKNMGLFKILLRHIRHYIQILTLNFKVLQNLYHIWLLVNLPKMKWKANRKSISDYYHRSGTTYKLENKFNKTSELYSHRNVRAELLYCYSVA